MIQITREDDLWIVTLDRPDKANALNADMLAELVGIFKIAAAAKAVILTGNGRVFSAGADLDAVAGGLATSPLWEELSAAIAALPGLTIAALNGTLAGGAFGMALACDMRIAVPEAKFFYPVMKLGYMPQPSDPKRLRALVGPARAKLILMASHKLTADEALDAGLVDGVFERDALMSTARDLCAAVLGADHVHISAIKALI